MKLNLGCGASHKKGFINVDKESKCNPEVLYDLEQFPYPWDTDSVTEIQMVHVIEHLGKNPDEFIKIICEMYRISAHKAKWVITYPHWRCDNALADPTHVRLITNGTLKLFDKKKNEYADRNNFSDTRLAQYYDVDIEETDIKFDLISSWLELIRQGKITKEQLDFNLNHLNNVCEQVTQTFCVHKPPRK